MLIKFAFTQLFSGCLPLTCSWFRKSDRDECLQTCQRRVATQAATPDDKKRQIKGKTQIKHNNKREERIDRTGIFHDHSLW